jgi:ATP-dependent DNA helicase RecQ
VNEIQRNLTPEKYKQLFGQLSQRQMEIISDKESRCIVVAAGPGSGKTRVLVHKLASLLLLEDVKHEQLLMLTFSRVAATEFKQRLMELIGNAAHYVEIKTFHAYCFDLLGLIGNLEEVKNVVGKAAEMIEQGEVEPNRIGKTVLVIDEAQDMGVEEHALVRALMHHNEEMRVIAVGDDDQNIIEHLYDELDDILKAVRYFLCFFKLPVCHYSEYDHKSHHYEDTGMRCGNPDLLTEYLYRKNTMDHKVDIVCVTFQ